MKAHRYVFTWAGKRGPMVRRFYTPHSFAGYLRAFSDATGQAVIFDTPFIARGAL